MSSEINPNPYEESVSAPVELQEHELEAIAGGADISFSMSMIEETTELLAQQMTGSDGSSSTSVFKSSRKSIFSLNFSGLGISSAEDFLGLLVGLSKLFGRR